MKIALFVEGGLDRTPPRQAQPPLTDLWNRLARELGLPRFEPVVPISKKHLVAMDPEQPRMSGCAEPLDLLMVRVSATTPFDAALVAWDLVPAWNSDGEFYRYQETISFYDLLSRSKALAEPWLAQARERLRPLASRSLPTRLAPGMALALCMEPMFEGLITPNEQALKRALGLAGSPTPEGWPSFKHKGQNRRPDETILAPAIHAVCGMQKKPSAVRPLRGDFRTNKTGWGDFILRRLLDDPQSRDAVLAHPLPTRMKRWLTTPA